MTSMICIKIILIYGLIFLNGESLICYHTSCPWSFHVVYDVSIVMPDRSKNYLNLVANFGSDTSYTLENEFFVLAII